MSYVVDFVAALVRLIVVVVVIFIVGGEVGVALQPVLRFRFGLAGRFEVDFLRQQILAEGRLQQIALAALGELAVVLVVLPLDDFLGHLAGGRQHAALAERGERRAGIEQAGGLQFLHARQGVDGLQAEVIEEALRGAPGDRTARRAAPPLGPDPADLQQRVESTLGEGHAADLLDLGAGDRLVVGDHRQSLQRDARQLAGDLGLQLHARRQVFGGAERPAPAAPDQVDSPVGIERLEVGEQAVEIAALRQEARELGRRQGLGSGEEQCLDQAQVVEVEGRAVAGIGLGRCGFGRSGLGGLDFGHFGFGHFGFGGFGGHDGSCCSSAALRR
jgi:hypothetical protein